MATYTMLLKDAIENLYGETMDRSDYDQKYEVVKYKSDTYGRLPVLDDNGLLIGLGYYPIFDEDYRKVLNGKIIDEYYNREICTETIDNFKFYLRKKMDQIMPYYNKLYASEQLEYNALDTMSIKSTRSGKLTAKGESTESNVTNSENDSAGRVVQSSTPQTMLAGNADYASAASDSNTKSNVKADSNQNSESNSENETEAESLVTGYQGIASDLIMRYRNSLLNIDAMILHDIEDCFMLVLNNGDSYSSELFYGWY